MVNINSKYSSEFPPPYYTHSGSYRDNSLNRDKTLIHFLLMMLVVFSMLPQQLYAANLAATPPLSGHAINQESITPADTLSRINLAAQHLEQIRVKLNLPLANKLNINISEAQPREVYFQALAFYQRVNRLTFERLRVFHESPSATFANGKQLKPYHVWQISDRASQQLASLRQDLALDEPLVEQASDPATTPSDVFIALLTINRQLDVMLEQPYTPNDVYQQVTLGVHYMAKLLASQAVIDRIPEAPVFIANKQPADVWLLLADCFELLREIAQRHGVNMLNITADSDISAAIRPGDVYQYAALLVSELAHLHSVMANVDDAVRTVAVSQMLSADVFQRVGLLHKQLAHFNALSAQQKTHGDSIDAK